MQNEEKISVIHVIINMQDRYTIFNDTVLVCKLVSEHSCGLTVSFILFQYESTFPGCGHINSGDGNVSVSVFHS